MKPEKSICVKCEKERNKHSEALWALHNQTKLCGLCQKNGIEHSKKLWEMHQLAVEKGQYCSEHYKKENLYPITIGGKGIARVCKQNADKPYDIEIIPIYMSCMECGLYLGDIEVEYADDLDGMCLGCFREQTDVWYDIPPVLKKEGVNC